ncbi:unnamed protein product [Mucor fragilis]
MSSIKVIGEANQVLEPVNQTLCEICQKQFSNYVCPRCNLRYCSLACYKDLQHADCTESFYKDSVTAEIQNRELDKDSKNKMLEMLKRLEEENDPNDLIDSDDEDDGQDNELMQRFANIDIDNTDPDLIWDLLSDKERLEFEQVLKSGDWNKLDIPAYQPWWKQHVSLIQDNQQDHQDDRPVMPKTVPDFTKMTQPATRSSPHLAWNLLHLLGTYSYLMRHSSGDLLEDPEDTAKVCEQLSVNVLYSKAADCPFQSVGDVVEDLTERIIDQENTTALTKREFNNQRRYDLRLLLLQDLESLLMNDCIRAIRQVIHMAIQGETTRVQTEKEEFLRDFEAAQDAIKKRQQQKQQAEKIKIQEL